MKNTSERRISRARSWKALAGRPAALLVLAGLYPAIFFAANHWYAFTTTQLLLLLFAAPVTSVLLGKGFFVAATLLHRSVARMLPAAAGAGEWLAGPAVTATASAVGTLTILLWAPGVELVRSGEVYLLLAAVLLAVGLRVADQGGMPRIAVFLALLTTIAAIQWLLGLGRAAGVEVSRDSTRSVYERVQFTTHPNIYLFVLESYQAPKVLRSHHGLESSLAESLLGLGFAVSPSSYSNYPATLSSLLALFTMEHHYYRFHRRREESLVARNVIGGVKTGNHVLTVLSNNGYRVQYAHPSSYMFFHSPALHHAFPPRRNWTVLRIFQSEPIDWLVAMARGDTGPNHAYSTSSEKYLDSVYQSIDRATGAGERFFTFIKARHSNHYFERWDRVATERLDYAEALGRCDAEVLPMIAEIRQRDPRGVVIVVGDHGSWKTRGAWLGDASVHEALAKAGFSAPEVTDDLFSTFLAIAPAEYMVSPGTTHVNLFREVFAALSGQPDILETRVEDASYLKVDKTIYLAASDGHPLESWEATHF